MRLTDRQKDILLFFSDPCTIKTKAEELNVNYFTLRRDVQKLVNIARMVAVGAESGGGVLYQSVKPELMPRFVDASGDRRTFIDIAQTVVNLVTEGKPPQPAVAHQMAGFYHEVVILAREIHEASTYKEGGGREINTVFTDRFRNYINDTLNAVDNMKRVLYYILETEEFFDPIKLLASPHDSAWDPKPIEQAYNIIERTKFYPDVEMPDTWKAER